MATAMTSGLRRGLVAALIIALALSGLGRAVASPSREGLRGTLAGIHVPICHAGAVPADPALPSSHDCCDACALLAAAVLPVPPGFKRPAPGWRPARAARVARLAPAIARPRDPRLSRGPPPA